MKTIKIALLVITFLGLTACYRMPTEEDYSVIPQTNNPDCTREKKTWMPNAKF